MGASAEGNGAGGDKKAAAQAEGKKEKDVPAGDEGPTVTAVFQFDMHCAGCAKKVKRAVVGFQGVHAISADSVTGKLTVSGHIDPAKLQGLVEAKMHKRVNLVSATSTGPKPQLPPPPTQPPPAVEVKPPPAAPTPPPPTQPPPAEEVKKPAAGPTPPPAADGVQRTKDQGAGGDEEKPPKPEGEDKPKEATKAPPPVSTVVMRMRLHCDDCIDRLRRRIVKIKGVEAVDIDGHKEVVTVKGTMDAAALPGFLKEKTGRNVEVVDPTAADNKDDGGEKKKKNKDSEGAGSAGGEKKNKEEAGDGEKPTKPSDEAQPPPPPVATANKMQFRGIAGEVAYAQPAPQAFAYASYGGGGPADGSGTPYAYPYPAAYSSYASPPPPMQQHAFSYSYPPPPYGADQPGPSAISVAYPPYGSGGGLYPGSSHPAGAGYFDQPPQYFSDENPNGCSVM